MAGSDLWPVSWLRSVQVMELLVHLNKRIKSRPKIQLPVETLLVQYQDPAAMSFVTVCKHSHTLHFVPLQDVKFAILRRIDSKVLSFCCMSPISFCSSSSAAFTKQYMCLQNFTIIYIKMGYPRLDVAKQCELAPTLLTAMEGKPEPQQDRWVWSHVVEEHQTN